MVVNRKRVPLIGLALFVLGASVVAITAESQAQAERTRPSAVAPESEASTPSELLRRESVVKQPSGTKSAGDALRVPVIANPVR